MPFLPQVLSTVTVVLLLVTFGNLASIKGDSEATGVPGSQLNPALAGTMMSAILIILLLLVSFFALLRKTTWAARHGGGASLIFTAASHLHVAIFLVLTGIVLTAADSLTGDLGRGGWTSSESSTLIATYVLTFVTVGAYLIVFVALVMMHRALETSLGFPEELGMSTALRTAERVSAVSQDGTSTAGTAAAVRVADSRAESLPPSDYRESVAAANRSYTGAWKT